MINVHSNSGMDTSCEVNVHSNSGMEVSRKVNVKFPYGFLTSSILFSYYLKPLDSDARLYQRFITTL